MRKKIYSMLALLCLTGTSAWADDYLYLEVNGTSATVKYGADKGTKPYYGDDPRDPGTYGWLVAEDEYMPDQVTNYNGKKTLTTVTIDASCQNYTGTTLESFFDFWSGLTTINNLENLNTSEVTNMKRMFTGCSSLTSFDLSGLNTAKVTNMYYMFNSVSVETLDLSGWNTSSVTNMYCMFYNCSKLETIYVGDGWSTASVTNGDLMFGKCTSLPGFDSGKTSHEMAKLTTDGGYLTYKAPEPEPSTYTVTLKEGTEDATSWTIAPAEATTTGVAAGTEVTATYSGMKKVKSVKAKKKASAEPEPAEPTLADVFTDGAVVGVAVKNTYDTYTVTGTYSGGSYTSYTKSSNDIEEVTMTKDGNNLVVWIKSDMNSECTLTFNTQDNTYTKSFKAGTGAPVWNLSEFVSITVNGTDITSTLTEDTPASEPFTTNQGITTYDGTHFTITCTNGGDSDGIQIAENNTLTITAKGSETIKKVEFHCGVGQWNASETTVTEGTLNWTDGSTTGSIDDVNATTVTMSNSHESGWVQIDQITVYYQ